MSEPLKKPLTPHTIEWKHEMVMAGLLEGTMVALNAAIDRINEQSKAITLLIDENADKSKLIDRQFKRIAALEAKYEGHTHKAILSHPLGPEGEQYTYTQPPIAPNLPDNGKEEA